MSGFVSDATVQAAVLDQLQLTNGSPSTATLEFWWPGLIARANAWAYGEIGTRLASRGYLPGQITGWDRGAEFQTDLAVWKALSQAQTMAPDTYSAKGLDSLDRRKELTGSAKEEIEAVGLTSGQLWVDPQGAQGQVVIVRENTATDHHVPWDPNDPRIGHPEEV